MDMADPSQVHVILWKTQKKFALKLPGLGDCPRVRESYASVNSALDVAYPESWTVPEVKPM